MKYEVIETSFGEHFNSVKIEDIDRGMRLVYDIRIRFDKMKVYVDSYGIKIGRQREFRYPKLDDKEYRSASMEERKLLVRKFHEENIPSEVLNLAMNEFLKAITVDSF